MLEIFNDLESLSHAAARLFADEAREAIVARGRFAVALSGGSTPRRTYELLAEEPLHGEVDWEGVHIFWGDERCVPPEDQRSNERMAREALLDRVPLDPRNVHPIDCAGDSLQAAADYEKLLQRYFGSSEHPLDLALLGLGDDGHTASLFPGSPALEEQARWVAEVRKPGDDFSRMTLTLPLFALVKKIVFIVSGASKAEVVRRVLEEDDASLPAARVKPDSGEVVWLLDRDAAGRLIAHRG